MEVASVLLWIESDLKPTINEDLLVVLLQKLSEVEESTKTKSAKLRVDSEHRHNLLEKEVNDVKTELLEKCALKDELENKLKTLQNDFETLQTQNDERARQIASTVSDKAILEREKERLLQEQKELMGDREKKQKELDYRFNDIANLNEQLVVAKKSKCEALTKVSELQSQEITLNYREKQIKQEKEFLDNQITNLTEELNTRHKELINIRQESANKYLVLQSELDRKTEEFSVAKQNENDLRNAYKDLTQKQEILIEKLKTARDAENKVEEHFKQELRSQTRLAELHEEGARDSELKASELISAVEELQRHLTDARKRYDDLEMDSAQKEAMFKLKCEEKEETIKALQKELKDANELLDVMKKKGYTEEGIENMSPSAAVASRLLKSGMTLTQIYSHYVNASEEVIQLKEENKKLHSYMANILQEVEERAPMINKQREDYEHSLETMQLLTEQLDCAIQERETNSLEIEATRRQFGTLTREKDRFTKQCADLTQQVRILLKQVEEGRGCYIDTMEIDDGEVSSSSGSSAQQIISKNLVTFRNIEELQKQNQSLLVVVRDLSEQQEKLESDFTDKITTELKEELFNAKKELTELKLDSSRQQHLSESVLRQRDMYKVLLQQQSPTNPTTKTPISSPASRTETTAQTPEKVLTATDLKVTELQTALTQLKEEYENYRKEKIEYCKNLTDELDKQRESISKQLHSNGKLASQIEYNAERFKISQNNTDMLRKQITSHENKTKSYTSIILKHEQTINKLKDELLQLSSKLSRAEVAVENLNQEKIMLRATQTQLTQERELLVREKSGQSMLMGNLEALRESIDRSQHEDRHRATEQIENLKRDNAVLQRRLTYANEQLKEASNSVAQSTKDQDLKLQNEIAQCRKSREELTIAYEQINQLKTELSQLEEKVKQFDGTVAPATPEEVIQDATFRELQLKLSDSVAETQTLKKQLTASKQHVEQYRSISEGVERQLNQINETSKTFRETMERRVEDLQDSQQKLEQQVDLLETERTTLKKDLERLSKEKQGGQDTLRQHLEENRGQLQDLLEKLNEAERAAADARRELTDTSRQAAEAQDKYTRELILHAADAEALNVLKAEIETHSGKYSEMDRSFHVAQEELSESKVRWTEREKLLKEETDLAKEQAHDLENSNRTLQDQLMELNSQLNSMRGLEEGNPSFNTSLEDENKPVEQLVQLIKYLRREKDIVNSRYDVIKAAQQRMKAKLEYVEKQMAETKSTADEEREHDQSCVLSVARHSEILRKIETLSALTDSNRLLREGFETLEVKFKESATKAKKLEEDILPLQEEKRDLSTKNDTLQNENDVLKNEVGRWRARTNVLIEKANKANPEELKQLRVENTRLQTQAREKELEGRKTQQETMKLNIRIQRLIHQNNEEKQKFTQQIAALTEESKELKNSEQQRVEECGRLKSEFAVKETQWQSDIKDRDQQVMQIRRIGRKYKMNYEELKAQADAKESEDSASSKAVASDNSEKDKAKEEMESKIKEMDETVKTLTEQLAQKNLECNELAKETEILKSSTNDKEEKTKQTLKTVRMRISQLTEREKKLEKENAELKANINDLNSKFDSRDEDTDRIVALHTQLENRIARLEKEKNVAIQEKERMSRENESLQQRLRSEHRGQGGQQKSAQAGATDKSASDPPTANIKPMTGAPSATPSKQQQVATAVPVSAARSSPFVASIRPLSMTSAGGSSKTATVMPTTSQVAASSSSGMVIGQLGQQTPGSSQGMGISSSVPVGPSTFPASSSSSNITTPTSTSTALGTSSSVDGSSSSTLYPDSTPSSSTSIIASMTVIPHATVTPTPLASSSTMWDERRDDEPPTGTVAPVTSEAQQVMTISSETPEPSGSSSMSSNLPQGIAMVLPQQQSSQQSSSSQQSGPSDSTTPTPSSHHMQHLKRVREVAEADTDVDVEGSDNKRTRNQSGQFSHPTTMVHPTSDQDPTEDQPSHTTQPTSSSSRSHKIEKMLVPVEDSDDDIVVLDSDDDDRDDEIETDEEEYDVDDDDEDDEMIDGMDEEDEDDLEEIIMECNDESNESQSSAPDDNIGFSVEGEDNDVIDIPHVEDWTSSSSLPHPPESTSNNNNAPDSNLATMESSPPDNVPSGEEVSTTTSHDQVSNVTQQQPVVGRPERFLPRPRQQAPSFVATASGYEESGGGDGIVPSTPTLFVPQRNDGFAEAVSSPHVPSRFLFGTQADATSGVPRTPTATAPPQTTYRGADDAESGRSVPSTPLHVSSPNQVTETTSTESIIEIDSSPSHQEVPTERAEVSEVSSAQSHTADIIPTITIVSVEGGGSRHVFEGSDASVMAETNQIPGSSDEIQPSTVSIEEDVLDQPVEFVRSVQNTRVRMTRRGTRGVRRNNIRIATTATGREARTPIVWDEPTIPQRVTRRSQGSRTIGGTRGGVAEMRPGFRQLQRARRSSRGTPTQRGVASYQGPYPQPPRF